MLHGAPAVSTRPRDATANIATMGTGGDDADRHWRTDFEPEERRRPRITEPAAPRETPHGEVDYGGAALPLEEGIELSPIRDAARSARTRAGSVPPGFPSDGAPTACGTLDLIGGTPSGSARGGASVCPSAAA